MSSASGRLGRKLLISLASLVVVVGTLELICRAAGYAPSSDYFRWMADPDLQAVPLPDQDTFFGHDDPETGQTLIPIRINRYGQRGADYPLQKAPGERRVVIVGDSLTMGQGVRDDETYPAVLSSLLSERRASGSGEPRVVNAGVNGWSSWHYTRWAQTQLERFQPDELVVGLFLGNDADPVSPSPQAVGVPLENFLRGSALYRFLVTSYRANLWKRVEAAKRGITVAELDEQLERYKGLAESNLSPEEQERLWEQHSLSFLERARDACRARGVTFVCLLIPTCGMVQGAGEPPLHAFLLARLAELGVPTVACLDALRADGLDGWLAWDTGHLSVRGNRTVARALADGLELLR